MEHAGVRRTWLMGVHDGVTPDCARAGSEKRVLIEQLPHRDRQVHETNPHNQRGSNPISPAAHMPGKSDVGGMWKGKTNHDSNEFCDGR
jgi:hypothetical protein